MNFEELLALDEAELYARYGRETGAGAAEPDPEAGGRARFKLLIANVRGRLCGDPRVKAFLTGGMVSDRAALCAVVLEVLSSLMGAQMPALPTATVLAVKVGLDAICKEGAR